MLWRTRARARVCVCVCVCVCVRVSPAGAVDDACRRWLPASSALEKQSSWAACCLTAPASTPLCPCGLLSCSGALVACVRPHSAASRAGGPAGCPVPAAGQCSVGGRQGPPSGADTSDRPGGAQEGPRAGGVCEVRAGLCWRALTSGLVRNCRGLVRRVARALSGDWGGDCNGVLAIVGPHTLACSHEHFNSVGGCQGSSVTVTTAVMGHAGGSFDSQHLARSACTCQHAHEIWRRAGRRLWGWCS